MINIKELQNLTRAAILQGQKEKQQKEKEELAKRLAKAESQKRIAIGILNQIPGRALIEANAGRNFAIVMSLSYSDYKIPDGHPHSEMRPEWIVSEVAKIVYTGCVDLELKPTLEYWYDGGGMDSGYNIVIHW